MSTIVFPTWDEVPSDNETEDWGELGSEEEVKEFERQELLKIQLRKKQIHLQYQKVREENERFRKIEEENKEKINGLKDKLQKLYRVYNDSEEQLSEIGDLLHQISVLEKIDKMKRTISSSELKKVLNTVKVEYTSQKDCFLCSDEFEGMKEPDEYGEEVVMYTLTYFSCCKENSPVHKACAVRCFEHTGKCPLCNHKVN
jgi:hypothetical protein